MSKIAQITETLRSGGLTRHEIEDKTGLTNTRSVLDQAVFAGKLRREGKGDDAKFYLANGLPRKLHRPPKKKRKTTRKAPVKRATRAQRRPPPGPIDAPSENLDFLPCMTGSNALVLIEKGVPRLFSNEETETLASIILDRYTPAPVDA